MPSLSPDPGFEYFFKACRKGDLEAKGVTVNSSAGGLSGPRRESDHHLTCNQRVEPVTSALFFMKRILLSIALAAAVAAVANAGPSDGWAEDLSGVDPAKHDSPQVQMAAQEDAKQWYASHPGHYGDESRSQLWSIGSGHALRRGARGWLVDFYGMTFRDTVLALSAADSN